MAKGIYPKIDILRSKVKRGTRICLKDACYIIWAELLACSDVWKDFISWTKENKISPNAKFKWEVWKAIYLGGYLPLSKARLDAKYQALRNDSQHQRLNLL